MGATGARAAGVPRDARSDEARRRTGFPHRLVRGAPLPGGAIALPGARGRDRRAHPGDPEHPSRLRCDAAAVWVHAPGPGRGEGGNCRHPLAGHASSGAPVGRHRWNRPCSMSTATRAAPSGPRPSRSSAPCGATSTSSGTARRSSSRAGSSTPKPYQDPSIRRAGWREPRKDPPPSRAPINSACSRSRMHAAPREDGGSDPRRRVPRGLEQPGERSRSPSGHDEQGRGLHAGALRGDDRAGTRQRSVGVRRLVVSEHRRVHPEVGAPAPPTRGTGGGVSAPQSAHGGQQSRSSTSTKAT